MSTPVSSQRSPFPDDREHVVTSPATQVVEQNGAESAGISGTGAVNASLVAAGAVTAPTTAAGAPALVMGRLRDVWRLITLNRKVLLGLSIVVFFLLAAAIAPLFIHTDPNAFTEDILVGPSLTHWLGTTQTGQDVFVQLVIGTRSSIVWGFITGLLVTVASVVIGLVAGYFGGIVDDILSTFINVFLVLPGFPLAIVLAAYFPFKGSLTVAIVITLTSWAWGARVLRAQTMSMRRRDFVDAARASGETTWRIIFFEILPNEIAVVAAGFVGTVIYVILASAGLEFLGLGDATNVSWGSMFYWSQNNDALLLGAWWWFLPPGLCIAMLGAGLALINFGIDEVANPRLRREPRQQVVKAKKAVA